MKTTLGIICLIITIVASCATIAAIRDRIDSKQRLDQNNHQNSLK